MGHNILIENWLRHNVSADFYVEKLDYTTVFQANYFIDCPFSRYRHDVAATRTQKSPTDSEIGDCRDHEYRTDISEAQPQLLNYLIAADSRTGVPKCGIVTGGALIPDA
jgi:hypothetical protein